MRMDCLKEQEWKRGGKQEAFAVSGLMVGNDGLQLQWWHLIWKEVYLKLFWMYQ